MKLTKHFQKPETKLTVIFFKQFQELTSCDWNAEIRRIREYL